MLWLLLLAAGAFGSVFVARPPTTYTTNSYGIYAATAATIGGGCILLLEAATNALWTTIPTAVVYALLLAAVIAAIWHARQLQAKNRLPRRGFESLALIGLALSALTAALATGGIIFTVAAESARFFQFVSPSDFLFGTLWSPQIAIREDQAGATGAFGFIPLLVGTLLITAIAMIVATPIGLIVAVYLSEFSSGKTRARIKPIMELLAGVPTVVYGFFAVATLSPILRDLGESLSVEVAGESALAAGLIMGVMLIPFIASISEDALFATPESLRQGALGLGSTRFEAATKVVMPAALPGIAAGILLALSRAIGETMIVVMAAGVAANLSINPLEAITTVTVQIVTLLTGDQEFDDPKTLAAFALGLALFFITLALNLLALTLVRRYQQHYD
ncbi:MAG: phosphate ABC transporter permease subunit PstC [Gammaproteobacteria bacterium WSBS_2016_MAG_OTU1]